MMLISWTMVLLVLLLAGATFAWYKTSEDKRAETKTAEVMTPYNLYLLNAEDHKTLQFAVGNLHPGETKQILFCVSNKAPEAGVSENLVRDSEFNYELELVHTENLAVGYQLYPLTSELIEGGKNVNVENQGIMYYQTEITGTDTTAAMRAKVFPDDPDNVNRVNSGRYCLYDNDDMKLSYQNGNYEYDYYMIEINWQNIANFNDYKKETDLVYLVVNAKQPKPVLKTNP